MLKKTLYALLLTVTASLWSDCCYCDIADVVEMEYQEAMPEPMKEVKAKSIEVLFIYMPGCPPCERLKKEIPSLKQLLQEYGATLIMKDGTNAATKTWLKNSYRQSVSSFPTLFIVVDGEVKETLIGYRSAQSIANIVKKYV